MSTFSDKLQYISVKTGLYKTTQDFTFYLNDDLKGKYVFVPSGTIFNGASIPWVIQKLFGWDPMDPRWVQASVLHDGLVKEFGQQLFIQDGPRGYIPSWNEAANWFNKALKVKTEQYKCPRRDRIAFVAAVKVYGIYRWIARHQSKKSVQ